MKSLLPLSCVLFTCAAFLASAAATNAEETRAVKVVLIGDSTVAPNSGWGDAFAKLLGPNVECMNLALGGRSSKSFRGEMNWAETLKAKPDWVLIQFGHNDQPGKGPKRETDAKTTFREFMASYVTEVRAAGGKPVLVTSLT